ncbi:hypothetical protein DX873_09355 [Flagellimonas nanhaiensis]|uniref:Uncharacterized protein n=1 Tax=Flagellimonas nanhaiensis TaxID=2292706 RepID=A0A371JPY3_9FLAO|nr:hypothetical protein DX873_09355 [Allomuricauda nanhaiensis]
MPVYSVPYPTNLIKDSTFEIRQTCQFLDNEEGKFARYQLIELVDHIKEHVKVLKLQILYSQNNLH